MRCFLIIIVSVCFNLAYSQQNDIDSLKNRLNSDLENNIEKLSTLKLLSVELIKQSKDENALKYFIDFYNLSKEMEDYKNTGLASRYISDTYLSLNDSLKSYNYAIKAIEASQKINDLSEYLLSINQLGRAYDNFNNHKASIDAYLKGLERFEKEENDSNNIRVITQIYLNLANSYYETDQNEKAHETLLKGIEYSEKNNDPTGVSYGLYFLGWKYMDLGNYEKAEKYFLESLSYADSIDLPTYIVRNYHGLGINYSRAGNYKKAIYYDSLAVIGYKKANNIVYTFDALNNMAVAFAKNNDYKNSAIIAEEALNIIKPFKNKRYENGVKQTLINSYLKTSQLGKAEKILKEVLQDTTDSKLVNLETKTSTIGQLSSLYEKQGRLREALKYQKQFKILADSIDAIKRESNFADIETKYQTEKKEKENLRLKNENAQQALLTQKANTQKWGFLIGFIVVLLASVLIWRRYKAESKAKKIISDQKDTIETLQKDLHHRVKNNLSIIDAFIDELKDDVDDKTMLSKLSELQNRILSINEVHAQLYKSTDVTSVGIKNYINSIAENVASIFDNPNIKIENKVSEHIQLDPSRSSLMGLIVNEFVTNSFKYAFNDTGKIEIDISETNDFMTIKLADNGKGLPENFNLETVTSYGFRIMNLLAKQLEGTFNFKNNHGLELNIQFPK